MYCKEKHEQPLELSVFGKELREIGIVKERLRKPGQRDYYYMGIKMRSDLRSHNKSLF